MNWEEETPTKEQLLKALHDYQILCGYVELLSLSKWEIQHDTQRSADCCKLATYIKSLAVMLKYENP